MISYDLCLVEVKWCLRSVGFLGKNKMRNLMDEKWFFVV